MTYSKNTLSMPRDTLKIRTHLVIEAVPRPVAGRRRGAADATPAGTGRGPSARSSDTNKCCRR